VCFPDSSESSQTFRIRLSRSHDNSKGSPWLRKLYQLFAPVREAAALYSEAEINTDIDQAVAGVRDAQTK
jgi:hypothetical protein